MGITAERTFAYNKVVICPPWSNAFSEGMILGLNIQAKGPKNTELFRECGAVV
jgi:hypothetical protein